MRVARVICVLSVLAAVPALGLAQCRTACPQKVVVPVAPVVVPAAIAVPVLVPAYSASYDSSSAAIVAELRGIREELAAFRGAQTASRLSGLAVLQARCASCHTASKAPAQGKEIVLLEDDGSLVKLSVLEKRAMFAAIDSDHMPPRNPLSAAEKKLVKDWIQAGAPADVKAPPPPKPQPKE